MFWCKQTGRHVDEINLYSQNKWYAIRFIFPYLIWNHYFITSRYFYIANDSPRWTRGSSFIAPRQQQALLLLTCYVLSESKHVAGFCDAKILRQIESLIQALVMSLSSNPSLPSFKVLQKLSRAPDGVYINRGITEYYIFLFST